jgi:hypothetical protein
MRARIASILLVAVCTLTPAFAQDGTPAADKPNQAQIDAALDLLKANNAAANMQTMMDVIMPLEAAEIRREHPNANAETIEQVLKIVNGAVSNHTDDLIHIYALAYARRFSVEELHGLANFYRSDLGQKYLKEMPGLVKEITPVGITFLKSVVSQEVEAAIAKLRAQGVKI